MESAIYVFGALAAVAGIVAGVFLSTSHRTWGILVSGFAITFVVWAGVFWFLDRLSKQDQDANPLQDAAVTESVPDLNEQLAAIAERANERSARDPGLSINMTIRILHTALDRKKYVLEMNGAEKEGVSIYITADNLFTFAVTDAAGESHPLRVGTGSGGIPLNERFLLTCEGGIGAQSTHLRIMVNARRLESIDLPFRMNFGALNIRGRSIGANLRGADGGVFDLGRFAVFGATLPDTEIAQLMPLFEDPAGTAGVRFRGNHFLLGEGPGSGMRTSGLANAPEWDADLFGT